MKKYLFFSLFALLSFSASAQLAWNTDFSSSDFNNALTVISKTDKVSWSNGLFGLGAGLSIGNVVVFGSAYDEECVIALPQIGIAEKLYFSWAGASGGTVSVYQSVDHNNWSQIFTADGNTISLPAADSVSLATNTRYIKFAATGRTAATFTDIRVSELKRLSASTDEWPFGAGMVDDAEAVKNVTVTWTNIVASVTSTDPHFSASLETVGQKNLIDQTTTLTISYLRSEAGTHSGEIVIAGEGREWRIAVSGTTSKYNQTLTWNQTLTECLTTDYITFNAFTTSGLPVNYLSSDTAVAYVEDGALHVLRAGTVTLTATQPGNYKYNASNSVEKELIIRKADPQVSASSEDLVYGQTLAEAVLHENNGFVDGALSWLDIATDTVLDAGDYTLSLLFTPADTGIYNYVTLPVTLTVNKAPQYITWDQQDTALVVGTTVLSAAVLSSGLPVTYAYTRCLLLIEDGIITPENEGEVTVVAYHAGNHNYLPTTVIMQSFTIEGNTEQDGHGVATDIENLTPHQLQAAAKFVHNGKVYISFAGRTYDAEGKLIK